MVALLFLLALLAFGGGVALFVADSRERSAQARDSGQDAGQVAGPAAGQEPQQDSQPERAREAATQTPAQAPTQTPTQTPAQRSESRSAQRAKSRSASLPASLPGGQRRERKAWAESHGFTFSKTDDLLAGEWHRGAAASGAAPHDVLAGSAYGHDTRIVDLGGTTVIAMTTGAVSPVVVDMRRANPDASHDTALSEELSAETGSDLAKVTDAAGFEVFGTMPGAVRRFVDKRVLTALTELPEAVAAVWCEGEWVLAELDQPGTQAWEDVLAPLALVADAARTLPPEEDEPFPEPPEPDAHTDDAHATHAAPLQRPENPVELPTRRTGAARGDFEDRELGDDDVETIAGTEHRTDLNRVRRQQKPPSIFDEEDTHE